jgi:hypothetical protein
MGFVVEASIAASWFLPDEATPGALARRAAPEYPTVPSLFVHEMRNLLVTALRRDASARPSFASSSRTWKSCARRSQIRVNRARSSTWPSSTV